MDFDPTDENPTTGFRQNRAELVHTRTAAHPYWHVIETVLKLDLPSVPLRIFHVGQDDFGFVEL